LARQDDPISRVGNDIKINTGTSRLNELVEELVKELEDTVSAFFENRQGLSITLKELRLELTNSIIMELLRKNHDK
jgi:hypothetical protein